MAQVTWQDFVKVELERKGNIDRAMILSARDGTLWGATPEFCPRLYEAEVTLEDGSDAKQSINERDNIIKVKRPGSARVCLLNRRIKSCGFELLPHSSSYSPLFWSDSL